MKKPPLIWSNVLFFSSTALVTLVGVPWYAMTHGFDTAQIVMAVLMLGYAGMSITMGYHRMWSHRTFNAHPAIRVILALGGALALQRSAIHWSSDHRVHHHHVDDNDVDPYSARMGFWYSHMGWMIREYHPDAYDDYSNVKDLMKDPVAVWQHQYYMPLVLIMNIGVTAVLGLLHGDLLGTLLLVGVARLTLSQHFTFFINSLAHMWGKQPYSDQNTAKDNGWIALITYGEGYHNFHHRFASDYRNGIRWWQFDPTKWVIKGLSFVGLTTELRRYSDERIERAKAALQLDHAKSKLLSLPDADALVEKLQTEYDLLCRRMSEFYDAKKSIIDAKKAALPAPELQELKKHYQELKASWFEQREHWKMVLALKV